MLFSPFQMHFELCEQHLKNFPRDSTENRVLSVQANCEVLDGEFGINNTDYPLRVMPTSHSIVVWVVRHGERWAFADPTKWKKYCDQNPQFDL
jgi:hypothetical protein